MTLSAHIAAALAKDDHRIVLTGATGWLGRATLDLLHGALGEAFAERVACFGSRHAELRLSATTVVKQRPLSELKTLSCQPTLLLHFAFLTKDRVEAMPEHEYCAANQAIRLQVLDALIPIGVEAVFVASSGAARYAEDACAAPAMRLYGQLKREDELAFTAWAESNGTSATIARVFNISGPHINKWQSYALSSFIVDTLAGKPIKVRAPHVVRRGYVAIRELMSLVFAMMLEKQVGTTRFDSGGESVEVGELARMIAFSAGNSVSRQETRSGEGDVYLGDNARYRQLLDRYGIEPVSLADQIAETTAFLRHTAANCAREAAYA